MKRTIFGLSSVVLALVCLAFGDAATSYGARLGQVGCFGGSASGITASCASVPNEEFKEEVQLGGIGGMAVDYSGNGGVPAGSVYAVTGSGPSHVSLYEPAPDGGLEFAMRWAVKLEEGPYEKCGPPGELPSGDTTHPACAASSGGNQTNVDVAVDQATGNVYVQLLTGAIPVGANAIVEYAPAGKEVITRFGQIAAANKKTSETPDQIHAVQFPGAIAVNSAGEVYVSDSNNFDSFNHRIMVFKPCTPAVYTNYCYAGQENDFAAGFTGSNPPPREPVVDVAGHVYVVGEEHTIEEYDPANPTGGPICTFSFPPGNIKGMTADPSTGAVYFFAATSPLPLLHELSPCDSGTGEFAEAGQIELKPERGHLWGLAFDPRRSFEAGRPEGMLYAGAPSGSSDVVGGKGEPNQSALGYVFAPSPEAPPIVNTRPVGTVGTSAAVLQGLINPNGFKTRYAFEYLTAEAYSAGGATFAGSQVVPVGTAVAGEGHVPVSVTATATGLAPGTEYRFRLVGLSNCSPGEPERVCEVVGSTEAFRTYAAQASGLPDNRAYELVSPAQKAGGQVFPLNPRITTCKTGCKPGIGLGRFPMQTSPDGETVAYEGSPFSAGIGAPNENHYVADRSATGWQSLNVTPQLMQSRGGEGYKALDESLAAAIIEQPTPVLSAEAPAAYKNLYYQSAADPATLRPLLTQPPPHRPATGSGGVAFEIAYAGASRDLSKVFFSANDVLTGPTSVAPEPVDEGGGKANLYEWVRSSGELRLVNVNPNKTTKAGAAFGIASAHAISADGSRVFWSNEAGQVYVRINGQTTVEVPDPGLFLAASLDGSKVLLNDGRIDELATGAVVDLTRGAGGFVGVSGYSDDLSHVYFVDSEVLTGEEENGHHAKAQPGQFNLYAWNEGTTRFIATLVAADESSIGEAIGISRDWVPVPTQRTAEASPSGRYFAFLSKAPLTGYANTGAAAARCQTSGQSFVTGPCAEAFLYDSATGELTCPSCNPSGAAPLGWTQLPVTEGPSTLPQTRFLIDSGRLYFDTGDSLSQFDTNSGSQDVYQWEPNGVGTCALAEACLSLISGGREGQDSNFTVSDSTGRNVFFTTRSRLVAKDQDELIDLYDAREFGGFPQEELLEPGQCQGEGCQPQSPAPAEVPPASSSVTGGGNAKPASCKKGQVKKKGKCAKKQKPKKQKKHKEAANHGGKK